MRSAIRMIPLMAVAAMLFAGSALSQSRAETLADIRQELSVLYVELQRLKRELSTTGAANVATGGATTLDRVNTIEGELARLIAKTEELEHRVDRVVRDGTNQVDDLAFRLCELESDCEIGARGPTKPLGGGELPAGPATAITPGDGGQMAVGEQADFDAALAALEAREFESAANRFESFAQTYPGGPLVSQAHYLRGEALAELGRTTDAARAFLTSFSGDPNGTRAPEALYRLGVSLGELGQFNEACVTLGEVGVRFPGNPAVAMADAAMRNLSCP
jgi:tol-pal system protein YbgF